MFRIDRQESGQVYRDGLAEVLNAPEFAEGPSVRRIVQVLEQPGLLEEIVDGYTDRNAVHVLISGDGRYEQLRDVSIVLARYGVGDRISGLLGVVGPVRMSYGRTIGAVRLVSDLMSELVEDLYGP
jgi:heat-inducible transcriptional repressor